MSSSSIDRHGNRPRQPFPPPAMQKKSDRQPSGTTDEIQLCVRCKHQSQGAGAPIKMMILTLARQRSQFVKLTTVKASQSSAIAHGAF
eukprot:3083890-Pyramimonas_sp.AAC.1